VIRRIHPVAGAAAFAIIAAFWLSTVAVELAGDAAAVAAVKEAVLRGLVVLIPALAATGASGFRLARGRTGRGGPLDAKRRRMPVIAANGLLVLVPCAVILAAWAQAGRFDAAFYAVQAVELAAGAANLALIGLNIRDGRRLARGRAARP